MKHGGETGCVVCFRDSGTEELEAGETEMLRFSLGVTRILGVLELKSKRLD